MGNHFLKNFKIANIDNLKNIIMQVHAKFACILPQRIKLCSIKLGACNGV